MSPTSPRSTVARRPRRPGSSSICAIIAPLGMNSRYGKSVPSKVAVTDHRQTADAACIQPSLSLYERSFGLDDHRIDGHQVVDVQTFSRVSSNLLPSSAVLYRPLRLCPGRRAKRLIRSGQPCAGDLHDPHAACWRSQGISPPASNRLTCRSDSRWRTTNSSSRVALCTVISVPPAIASRIPSRTRTSSWKTRS